MDSSTPILSSSPKTPTPKPKFLTASERKNNAETLEILIEKRKEKEKEEKEKEEKEKKEKRKIEEEEKEKRKIEEEKKEKEKEEKRINDKKTEEKNLKNKYLTIQQRLEELLTQKYSTNDANQINEINAKIKKMYSAKKTLRDLMIRTRKYVFIDDIDEHLNDSKDDLSHFKKYQQKYKELVQKLEHAKDAEKLINDEEEKQSKINLAITKYETEGKRGKLKDAKDKLETSLKKVEKLKKSQAENEVVKEEIEKVKKELQKTESKIINDYKDFESISLSVSSGGSKRKRRKTKKNRK